MVPVQTKCTEMCEFQTPSEPSKASSLPANILTNIFKHLDFKPLGRMTKVCKSWRAVAIQGFLWRHFRLEVLAHYVSTGKYFSTKFLVPTATHLAVTAQNDLQLIVKNKERLLQINRSTGEVLERNVPSKATGYKLSNRGVLAIGPDKVRYRYKDGFEIVLPYLIDEANKLTYFHFSLSEEVVYVLTKDGLTQFDLTTERVETLIPLNGFNHNKSRIEVNDGQLFLLSLVDGNEGKVTVWDCKQKKIECTFNAINFCLIWSDATLRTELYLETAVGITVIDLKTKATNQIVVPNHRLKSLDLYNQFSKALVQVCVHNQLFVDYITTDEFHLYKFEIEGVINSIQKVNIVGRYIICHQIDRSGYLSESSLWQISGSILKRIKLFDSVYSEGYLLNGAFYQPYGLFNGQLEVIDLVSPPYRPLIQDKNEKAEKGCSVM